MIDNVRLMDEMRKRMVDRPSEAEPMPRSKRVEAAMLAIEDTEREREELRQDLDEAKANLRGLQAEHDAMMLANSRLLTEMERHQREREEAIARLAAFSAVFDACLTIMQKHREAPEEPRG